MLGCCRDIIANELFRELSKSDVVPGKMFLKDSLPVSRKYILFDMHTHCLLARLYQRLLCSNLVQLSITKLKQHTNSNISPLLAFDWPVF